MGDDDRDPAGDCTADADPPAPCCGRAGLLLLLPLLLLLLAAAAEEEGGPRRRWSCRRRVSISSFSCATSSLVSISSPTEASRSAARAAPASSHDAWGVVSQGCRCVGNDA